MTLAQHGSDSPAFEGKLSDRRPVATRRPREKLADVRVDDAWSAVSLARRLRDEWRRERYARLKDD